MSTTPRITLLGAETGKIKAISEPLAVYRVTDLEGEQIAARFVLVPPRMERICASVAAWYIGQTLGARGTQNDIEEEKQLLMLSYALRRDDGHYKSQVFPFPSVLSADGLTFKPDNELLVLVRDADVRLYCAQADVLWVDYLNFKATQFPDVATKEALGQLLEDAQKKSLSALLLEHGYWKVTRLARGLVRAIAASRSGTTGAG